MIGAMDTGKSYEKVVFPNGARLIIIPMTGVQSIATSVMVNVGSRYETPGINGISHFLEHMVFKGTKKFPTTEDVNFIERLGGLQNAYTDIDVTNYHNKVLAGDWQEALELNKELALHPRLEEKYVEKERNVILEELKREEDEPAVKVGETFHEMLYPGTKLGMRIIGTEKALRGSDATKLRRYHDAWYQPERMVVVVAGNVSQGQGAFRQNSGQARVKGQVEAWFGTLKKNTTEKEEVVFDGQKKPQVAVVTKPDAQQAHLTLGLRVFARSDEDRFAWTVFNLLFGVSFTSRLFKEIREKRGLCYAIRSNADTWADVGYWSVYAGVATDKVQEATSAIMDELKKVVENGVTEEEVAVARKRLLTMLAFRSEDPEFMNEYYGRQELFHLPVMTLDDYFRKVRGVTKEMINTVVRKYIVQKNLNLALVWNKPEDESLVQILRI